jgi:hypothetical protein
MLLWIARTKANNNILFSNWACAKAFDGNVAGASAWASKVIKMQIQII